MTTRVFAVRKRLSALWNVEPYRIEVEIGLGSIRVELDGKAPSSEQMHVFEQDIEESTAIARSRMN